MNNFTFLKHSKHKVSISINSTSAAVRSKIMIDFAVWTQIPQIDVYFCKLFVQEPLKLKISETFQAAKKSWKLAFSIFLLVHKVWLLCYVIDMCNDFSKSFQLIGSMNLFKPHTRVQNFQEVQNLTKYATLTRASEIWKCELGLTNNGVKGCHDVLLFHMTATAI